MRALIIYCHPNPDSFTAAVRDQVLGELGENADVRMIDLYAENFDPSLGRQELADYEDEATNRAGIEKDVADIKWADTLIFIYPTWWYGLPARLKGWLDRVLVPGVAFIMPKEGETIRPGLINISQIGVFTTCGASRWLTWLVGAPGKRTLTRGVRLICAKPCKVTFAAHYLMDSSTPASRSQHLTRVAHAVRRMTSMRTTT